ncbi:MAG: hypothetical protein ACAF41_29160 [Leptolyngbya sp. BL-A-14]
MYDDQALQSGREYQSPSGLSLSFSIATEPLPPAKTANPALHLSNSTLFVLPFSLLTIGTIALFCFKQQAKGHNSLGTDDRLRLYKRVPCRRCAFFKNNPYLKCAIRPSDALTAKAIECSDFTLKADLQHKR